MAVARKSKGESSIMASVYDRADIYDLLEDESRYNMYRFLVDRLAAED